MSKNVQKRFKTRLNSLQRGNKTEEQKRALNNIVLRRP